MIFEPRLSQISTDKTKNQIAIVHRQGNQISYLLNGLVALGGIIYMVILSRSIGLTESFGTFVLLVLLGLAVFILETLVIRQVLYSTIIYYQGVTHPKLLIAIVSFTVSLLPKTDPYIRFVLLVTLILTSIDTITQNQLHDIISIIRPNYWEILTAIPVFHIPFQRRFEREPGEDDTFMIAIKLIRDGRSTYQSEAQISDLIHTEEPPEQIKYIEIYQILPSRGNREQPRIILTARFNNLSDFRKLFAAMNETIKITILALEPPN